MPVGLTARMLARIKTKNLLLLDVGRHDGLSSKARRIRHTDDLTHVFTLMRLAASGHAKPLLIAQLALRR